MICNCISYKRLKTANILIFALGLQEVVQSIKFRFKLSLSLNKPWGQIVSNLDE